MNLCLMCPLDQGHLPWTEQRVSCLPTGAVYVVMLCNDMLSPCDVGLPFAPAPEEQWQNAVRQDVREHLVKKM